MPDAERTRRLACNKVGSTHASRDRYAGPSGIPCAMVYGLYVLLCLQTLSECANGRLDQNRPSLDLSPCVLEGHEPVEERGTEPVSSSTRTVAWAF
jgi:hypothetical protein